MTTPTNAIDPRALSKRLDALEKDFSSSSNDTSTMRGGSRRAGTSSSRNSFPSLPRFTKSETMSSTSSGSTQFSRLHGQPSAYMDREHAEAEFSKPRTKKRVRSRSECAPPKEFQYYGRHSNQWLFNDFSVSGAVRKGFGKVFGRDGGDGEKESTEKEM
jgi:hypothetical protein